MSVDSADRATTAGPVASPAKSWWPTRKWWAATVVAIGAILTLWVTKGELDKDVLVAAIAAVVQAATTYIVPNDATPGGVPVRNA